MKLNLTPGKVTLDELSQIYWDNPNVELDQQSKSKVENAAKIVENAANGDTPVYGINTGFGKLASIRIPTEQTELLQRNLILSHCCGVGEVLPEKIVRMIMTLKMLSLARGASGVRWELIEQIGALLKHGVTPVIPSQGSVGASGDLAPLAHMTAVLIGEGHAVFREETISGAEALDKIERKPLVLRAKEGLAMINGTQVSTALALAGVFEGWRCSLGALVTGALSTDAAMASTAPFHSEIQLLRGHQGQIDAAQTLLNLMRDSEIRDSHLDGDTRVQDPYCIRCQPQVSGACLDLLRQAAKTLAVEANAVTDNPLVLSEGKIISGGNFHAEPVAFAADQTALALSELGAITQRRIALMVDPNLNFGLPPFLSPDAGVNCGFMVAEITSAALMSENKHLANPCSTDSTPTSADQEDHVSMATHAARRLLTMNDNLGQIIGIELLTATQGLELRKASLTPLTTSSSLNRVMAELREKVAFLQEDRFLAPDLEKATILIRNGKLLKAAGEANFPKLPESTTQESV
ncbi:MAG: histidine ammonia-lyase [Deltaproteobacteria bacterium]|jgi:histidine ammonia-lyase|nr:histidine ammonia-lyase [Deltaproteobacteria bacterium]MBT7810777.1 histidine ammonia-lyase [Deltaproteobacteria bacterium]